MNPVSTHTINHLDISHYKHPGLSPDCIGIKVNSRQFESQWEYGGVGDKLFKDRMAAFLAEHPEFTSRVAEEVRNPREKYYDLACLNLSYPNSLEVCDEKLRKQIDHYKKKYGIEIEFVTAEKSIKEMPPKISALVSSMAPNSYKALLLFDFRDGRSAPVILYKRQDGKSESLIIRRTFEPYPKISHARSDVSLERAAKGQLFTDLFVKRIYAACSSHPAVSSDSIGNLTLLRNAMLAMRLDKYKSCEGFEQIFQAAGITIEKGCIASWPDETVEVPPEWNYGDQLFDMANGRGKAVAVHTLYGNKGVERVKMMNEVLVNAIGIVDLRKLISSYIGGGETIEEFRSRYTFTVTMRHEVTFNNPTLKVSFTQRQQMCVYTILKQFKVAGLPMPSNRMDSAETESEKSTQIALVATTASK